MKSDLFKKGHFLDDDDKKGLVTFCELSDSEFNKFLAWYSAKLKEKSSHKAEDLLPLSRDSKFSASEIIGAFNACFHIIYFCFDYHDKTELITDDLIESGIVKVEMKDTFSQRFESAYNSFKSEISEAYVQETATRFTNRLLSFGFKCEVIPKFEPEYKISKLKVEDYKTKIENFYPVLKLFFGYENEDGKKEKRSFYIVNDKIIDDMIDALLAAKIQLNEINRLVPIVKNHSV